ncbi:uncharacterized protein LOC105420018 isoform X1 [Amborella trichopoda]|uniref:Uncharacterized protein n=1 Tax=Amborella trichopoda TaxID=13333 RepID=W1NP10_AMBTC|nr:uncharacterized protein LOC105420018 isoform X1 [Amborella trichopoda]XP_020517906.1 uncharacterized protein LOC105420018 isoform X1 [Amborella trichopoda]XP_020517907.1 uncharacterized protein LOC105420018 isoform X1 [Amborella trichopoda]XP_020517908.1 uncharacterized protein LOC105420018 isoform X1 [Amborella trichopoda]XP_020517909.1 uncharacterized protein LOC105420018 isoform X1 [Amborella trichopoda]ERM97941.1 hypothetical protein AMTR_s00117p00044080 [Amborella trichopoda]|eukprot:XP_020517905.1 uncharacterized protein LOC105420018 isoform X1 [Amborella trichopoda]
MTTRRAARVTGSLRMRNPARNDTLEDAIIIADDEPPVVVVEEDPGHVFNINPDEPSSSLRPPQSMGGVRTLPHSGRVLFTPAWFTRGGIVPEQLRISFSTQVEGLDYLSADIGVMEYGKELLKAVHRLIGRSSLEELIQLPNLLERTAANLTAFGVPEASKLKKIMEELAQEAKEILKLERLISPTLNPSIGPLLNFYSDQPSIFGYAEGLLAKLKSDLAYREGFHPTLKAHSLKEGEDAALGGISLHDNEAGMIVLKHHIAETEALLSRVREELSDLPLNELESGAFPLLVRHAGSLKVAELKDRLGIRQRVFTEIGAHKE